MPTPTTAPVPEPEPRQRGMRLPLVLLVLTVVSGLIDAVGYLGLGRVFTANMTGNVIVLGFAAVGAPGFSVPLTATSLGCFLLGAAAGGRLTARVRRAARLHWTRLTLTAETLLVGASAAIAFAWPGEPGTRYALIALTALAMGLRNATVRALGVPDLTTTVLTMTLTGLAAESRLGSGTGQRSPRRTAAVLAMFAGACLGAWLVLHHGLGIPLLLAALASAVLAALASDRD
ncbi:YoaK family protein [Streptomyces sp. NPDC048208]|uniref:YoaK family protein n=1 Tax=Streptomyces sp. NPDC048208 TaxID=3365515 RepID=UPI00371076F1